MQTPKLTPFFTLYNSLNFLTLPLIKKIPKPKSVDRQSPMLLRSPCQSSLPSQHEDILSKHTVFGYYCSTCNYIHRRPLPSPVYAWILVTLLGMVFQGQCLVSHYSQVLEQIWWRRRRMAQYRVRRKWWGDWWPTPVAIWV